VRESRMEWEFPLFFEEISIHISRFQVCSVQLWCLVGGAKIKTEHVPHSLKRGKHRQSRTVNSHAYTQVSDGRSWSGAVVVIAVAEITNHQGHFG